MALVMVAACYAPHPQAGAPCPTGQCPDPLVCSPATGTCELTATDAPRGDSPQPQDARLVDAARDSAVPIDAALTATLVQQQVAHADQSTLAVTLPAMPTAGNVLVMIGADEHAPLTNVTGGGVATWTLITGSQDNTNVEIWYGVTNGTNATVTLVGPPLDTHPIFANVSEWSGLAATGTVDATRAHSGLSSPADPLAITTTHAHDLVLFGVGDLVPNTYGTPGPGAWTALTPIDADISLAAWFRIVAVAGTVHPTVSETEGDWDAAVAALAIAP